MLGVGWGDVGELVFTLVLYISCQQFGGYVKVVGCLWALQGGCMSLTVYIGIVYIMPTIGGIIYWVSVVLDDDSCSIF